VTVTLSNWPAVRARLMAAHKPKPLGKEMPLTFQFTTSSDMPIPPDALREAKHRSTKARDRNRKASLRPGARLTLDAALWRAIPLGPHSQPGNRKRYQQATAALRILADLGCRYVDAVTEEDLLAVIERSLAQGLAPGAIRFRLGCLAMLGVEAARLVYQIGAPLKR
jgi:hypothetical protein